MRFVALLLLASALDAQNTAAPVRSGTTLPASCYAGETFLKTDAASGANVYGCLSANTWTVQGGAGSASGIGACAASKWASTLNAGGAPTCTQPAASDVANAFTIAAENTLTNVAAPSSPSAGFIKVYSDSTNLILSSKNPSGVVSNTVVPDTGAASNFLTAISASGVISKARPACASLSNAAASCSTDTTNASNINAGTLGLARGGTNADLSGTGGTSQFLKQATAGAAITVVQPAASDITNAFDITAANTLTNVAAPSSPSAGFVKVFSDSTNLILSSKNPSGVVSNTVVPDTGAASNFLTAISASGVISKAQPACASLSNAAASCSTDATNGSNISSGTVAAARVAQLDQNTAGSAATLTTGRTLAITGDLAWTSPSFNGGANVTAAGTLASVATAGTTGSSTAIPVITINVKGLTTLITTAAVVAPAGTLSGTTLASGVTASSLTSVGTLASPALTTPVVNNPTIGISGTAASAHVKTVGSAPTCTFSTGGGSSPSCALQAGSTDHAGTMVLSTGTGSPGSAGTVTLTFNATMGTNSPACIVSLTKGAVDWSVSSTVRMTTFSTTAPVFTWNSQSATALVTLTTSTAGYDISYVCFAK